MVSGSFHSAPAVLFTFPSRYFSTIGHWVVFRLGWWSTRILCGFHVSADTLDTARSSSVSFTGLLPSMACLPRQFYYRFRMLNAVRNPEGITTLGLASSRFARRYFGNLGWFLFLRLLRCFSSAGLPPHSYLIQCTLHGYCPCGLPHSEIHGSMDICSSPWLIAACHVLRRLLMPRHSPCALYSLTNQKQDIISFSLWIMQASQIVFFEIVIVTHHLFRCCSTIKLNAFRVFSDTETSLLPYLSLS